MEDQPFHQNDVESFLSPMTDQSPLLLSQEVERGSQVEEEVTADFIQQLESRISTEVPKTTTSMMTPAQTNPKYVCTRFRQNIPDQDRSGSYGQRFQS